MRIPFASRTLLVVVLSTTTACASTEPPPPCTMIGAGSSAVEISWDLIPPKAGRFEVCVNSACNSGKLESASGQGFYYPLKNPTNANEATITLKITADDKRVYDEKTTIEPMEFVLNGPNCGSEFVLRLTADRTGLHPTP